MRRQLHNSFYRHIFSKRETNSLLSLSAYTRATWRPSICCLGMQGLDMDMKG